jgi:heme/copper-type cytochrome/quinol oxidase subunit 4
MRHHLRVVAILAVCATAYGVLVEAFHWMNQPRDSSGLGGMVTIFGLLVIVPVAVHTIWRRL